MFFVKMGLMKGMKTDRDVYNITQNTRKILDIPIFGRGIEGVLDVINNWLSSKDGKVRFIVTVNAEHMMAAINDERYRNLLNSSDLNTADGIAVIWAREVMKSANILSRVIKGWNIGIKVLKGKYSEDLAAGSDLMERVVDLAARKSKRVLLLGGWDDRAKKSAKYFEKKYPKLMVAAMRGEPDMPRSKVLEEIRNLRPEVLFVAYGMKKQEEWIQDNLGVLKEAGVMVVMGVGRSFDYYSGELKRAPVGWRKAGMEWFYSLIREPKRWRRQLALPRYIWKILTIKQV